MEKHINFKNISFFFSSVVERSLDLELTLVSQALNDYLEKFEYEFEVNINLISSSEIKEINSKHRNKDKVTDVLSFPIQDNFRNKDFLSIENKVVLGDILIADEICQKQAKDFNISYQDEFLHLCIHGIVHLLGFDHEISNEEEKLMNAQEQILLKKISEIKKRP